ncbi:MAG: hypothetical protein M0R80_21105 [Proteobacteria bacterium]|jgi:hypothetical protein|nr:hypothetical protein [Pseudomonadota bacterium]
MDGMDGVDGAGRLGTWAAVAGFLAAAAGCYEVASSSDAGAPDADSDTDTDSDADSDTDQVQLSPGFEDNLTSWGGCGDVFLYGWGEHGDGQVELVFEIQGKVLSLYEAGGGGVGLGFALASSSGGATLVVRLGLHLPDDDCTDIAADDTVIWRSYAPVGGIAFLDLVTTADEWSEWNLPALATLELVGVALAPVEDDAGDPVTLPYLFVENISVGWFPG